MKKIQRTFLFAFGIFCLLLLSDGSAFAEFTDEPGDNPQSTETIDKPETKSEDESMKEAVETVQEGTKTVNEGTTSEDPNKDQPAESDRKESGKESPTYGK